MNTALLTEQKLFGLFELNAAGTVLYSRIESDASSGGTPPNMVGRNFYNEIALFGSVEELRQLIGDFAQSCNPTATFHFNYESGSGAQRVSVLLARVRERSDGERTKSILLHIKKAH